MVPHQFGVPTNTNEYNFGGSGEKLWTITGLHFALHMPK